MTVEQEQRRIRLLELMAQTLMTCDELGAAVDRKPHTVRCWRSGFNPITDHTLALIELLVRHGYLGSNANATT